MPLLPSALGIALLAPRPIDFAVESPSILSLRGVCGFCVKVKDVERKR
jgi:hypothetical protein